MTVITISASYGAGGSVIAPMVAERLGVPYLARAVAAQDSQRIETEAREEAFSEEQLEQGIWQRVLSAVASVPAPAELGGISEAAEHPDRALRAEAQRRLRQFEADGGGVVLGWAASIVVPAAFAVRLDGPESSRIRQGGRIESIDEAEARQRLGRTDEVRRRYWRRLYQADWRDPGHFHLWVDSTAVPFETTAALIVEAVRGFETVQD